jgi:tRNA G46 methylase TrmB
MPHNKQHHKKCRTTHNTTQNAAQYTSPHKMPHNKQHHTKRRTTRTTTQNSMINIRLMTISVLGFRSSGIWRYITG